jgi:ribosomal protein S18 acetylase RimI-like enzyme
MQIRRAVSGDENGIAKVHVKSWQSTYKGIMKDDILNNLSVERREKSWKEEIDANKIIYVALNNEGQIIGFISGGRSRSTEYSYDGELYAIYILAEYLRQGIGKKLISQLANELIAIGYQSMIVWVLRDNPAINAYKELGAISFDSKDEEIGGELLKEEVLVWKDLNNNEYFSSC